jgi:hypothetical protein
MATGESRSGSEGRAGASRLRARMDRWLDSDLVGIPATLYTFAVLAISLAVFRFGGPIAGLVVAALLWIPMVLFAIQGRGKPPVPIDVTDVPEGPLHRVLVIANEGLEDPALCREVCRRSDRTATEALVLAPVVASSRLGELADDVDAQLGTASRRVEAALRELHGEGVRASGRTNIASPMESLADGLREFPPNEIVMLPGREADWDAADDLAERVRTETGLPVTAVGPRAV